MHLGSKVKQELDLEAAKKTSFKSSGVFRNLLQIKRTYSCKNPLWFSNGWRTRFS